MPTPGDGTSFGQLRTGSLTGSRTGLAAWPCRLCPGRTRGPPPARTPGLCLRNPARPAAERHGSSMQATPQLQLREGGSRPKTSQMQSSLRQPHAPWQAQSRQHQRRPQQQAEAGGPAVPTVMTSFPEHLQPEVLANGLLLVDKPQHWEVPEVVAAVQRATGADKVASVAPLDACASGLMLLCFGSATRLAPRVERAAKRYTGTLVLGGSSLSGDVRGGSYRAAQLPAEHLTDEDLEEEAQGLVTAAAAPDDVAGGRHGSGGSPLRVLPLSRRLRQLPSSTEYYEEQVGPSVRTTDMRLLDFRVWRESVPGPTHDDDAAGAKYHRHEQQHPHHGQHHSRLPAPNPRGYQQSRPPPFRPVVLRFSALMAGRSHVRSLIAMYGRRLRTVACLDNLRRTDVGGFNVEEAWPLEALVPVLQRHRR